MPLLGRIIKRGLQLRNKIARQRNAPMEYQEKVLLRLLQEAKDTEFGRAYNFARILKTKDPIKWFRERVPVHDYDSIYDKWWHKMTAGKANVCWPGQVKYFALSSGTTGAASKYIPVSKQMIKAVTVSYTHLRAHETS